MRVLATADCVGGVWTYALDLARGMAVHGLETVLALSGPPPSLAQRADAERVPGLSLVETGSPLDWMADTPEDVLAAGRAIGRLAAEVGADLVHLNSPALAAEGAFPCPIFGTCHSCVATWWTAVRGGALPADFRWRTELTLRGYAACQTLVAPSAAFAEATRAAYGLRTPPAVIHNGRAANAGISLPDGERVPAPNWKTPVAALTAGRLWDEGKNLATLDRAAARTAVPVVAAGPATGPNGAQIAFRHIEALGSLSPYDLADRLAGRPIFVSLARYEPFGLAVLEAAQHGCPLVLSDIPTFRELWDGAVLFVAAGDDRAAAAALDALAGDATLRDRQGALARARSADYGLERMIEGTLALYAATLDRAAAPSLRAAS